MGSYILYPKSQRGPRQNPFMHPWCLEAHATPSHGDGDRAPRNPPSIRQHPLTPATAPGSPVVPCSKYTHAHETEEEKMKKKRKRTKVPREMEKTTNRWKGPASHERRLFQVGALRDQECTNRARSESEIPVSSSMRVYMRFPVPFLDCLFLYHINSVRGHLY